MFLFAKKIIRLFVHVLRACTHSRLVLLNVDQNSCWNFKVFVNKWLRESVCQWMASLGAAHLARAEGNGATTHHLYTGKLVQGTCTFQHMTVHTVIASLSGIDLECHTRQWSSLAPFFQNVKFTYRATARDVITHRNQYKISCKIHFRMASKIRVQMCAVLEPQLQLFWNFCTNGCLSIWFILSLC